MTTEKSDTWLVADIGGTNARFAWAGDGRPGTPVRLGVADHEDFEAALAVALEALPAREAPYDIAIAAAGPVTNGRVAMTNAPWTIDQAKLGQRDDIRSACVINDFQAIAMALPHLKPEDRTFINAEPPPEEPSQPMLVIGPGTGLGMALSIPDRNGGWIPVATEGGHAELAGSIVASEIGDAIRRMVGEPAVAEDILCGGGLVRVHEAHGGSPIGYASAVVAAAREGDPTARAAVRFFLTALGAFAGDAALQTGAFGGVYLAGGVTTALADAGLFNETTFRTAFIHKKSYREIMTAIPVARITHPEPALLGLAAHIPI